MAGEYIGVCTECHNQQPAKYMVKSPFDMPSCRYCGGVVMAMSAPEELSDEQIEQRLKAATDGKDAERGIYNSPSVYYDSSSEQEEPF